MTTRARRTRLASLALGLAAIAAVAMPLSAVHATAPAPDDADRIASAVFSDATMANLIRVALRIGVELELAQHPGEHADYANDPALKERVWRPVLAEAENIIQQALPELRHDLAQVFEAELTPVQRSQLARFFETPTGVKFIRIIFSHVAEHPEDETDASRRQMMRDLIASMTPDDNAALMLLEQNNAGQALKGASAHCNAVINAWSEKLKARHLSRLHDIYIRELKRVRAEQRHSQ